MSKKLGFGLLGTGLVAPFHAKSIVESEKCDLIAVADIDPVRAKTFAQQYNCKAYATLNELIADKNIDVINILTPNHLHYEAVLKIASAGKSILVEKPPALSLGEVDEMIALSKKQGIKIGVVLQCRVRPAVQAIKNAIDSGRFGRLLQADVYMKWFRTTEYYHSDPWRSAKRSGAGVTIQHAFHYIDLLYYLAGPVTQLQGRMNNLAHPDVELEDTVMTFLDFKNGAQGVVQASTALWPGTDIRLEINGSDGTAIVIGERIDTWKFKTERPDDETIRKIGRADIETAATGPAAFSHQDHQLVIEDMVDAILEDRDPCISLPATRGTLEIALAMYQSAKRGDQVNLPIQNENDVWE